MTTAKKHKLTTLERRVDAGAKIRGDTQYIKDMKIPGMWYGKTIRSPHAHARILNIHFDQAFDWNNVVTVTAREIPTNFVAMLEEDMPFLAEEVVKYIGEAVVLVAADTQELLEEAAQHIRIEYQPLPALFDIFESELSFTKIYRNSNIFKEIAISRGDVEKAGKQADEIIKMDIRTGFQEHLYLEPQGVIAIPEQDRITLHGSLQCPYYVKNALKTMFAGKKHITVIQAPTGGAFGGKEDYPSLMAGHAALLAAKSGHPIGMFYDREEDVQVTTKRHPSYHRDVVYVRRDGQILGAELTIYLDGGAYCTLSPVVLARSALTALGSYYVPNVRILAKAVATHTVPGGAFRGFGGPQAVFAIEMLIEKIALKLNLSPKEVREKNLIRKGQKTATGQILKYSVSTEETFHDALKRSKYDEKYQDFLNHNQDILRNLRKHDFTDIKPGEKLKGIGISVSQHGAGFTGTGENKIQGKIRVEVQPDGRVKIFSAATEMGQGEQTVIPSIMAKALGVGPELIILSEINTDLVPDSGPTVASRTTMIVGSLLIEASKDILKEIKQKLKQKTGQNYRYVRGMFRYNSKKLTFQEAARYCGGLVIEKQYHHPPIIQFDDIHWTGDAYPVFSWAAAVAEIEVDPVTFEVKVIHYTTSHDIGKAINPDQVAAQIQGGTLQGIGYALYEKVQLQNGHFDITGFTDYIIPTVTEMPEFDISVIENPYPYGPFGAKGLGELPLVGAAPAVVSALWMIFSEEFNEIPVLPERLAAIFERDL
jgi:CO/xanthine dehydrogenase Mo-binding subunit